MRKWYNVELSQRKAELFVEQLEKVEFGDGFSYEVSEVSGIDELRHFELYLESHEVETCNLVLDFVNCLS